MQFNEITVGARLICVNPSFIGYYEGGDAPPKTEDVFGKTGTVRAVDTLNRHFWITWDESIYNTTIRGKDNWSRVDGFELADSSSAMTKIKRLLQQHQDRQDQQRRQEHAMKYL